MDVQISELRLGDFEQAAALCRSLGEEGYRNRVALTRSRIAALAGGSLRHVHIQAFRPAADGAL